MITNGLQKITSIIWASSVCNINESGRLICARICGYRVFVNNAAFYFLLYYCLLIRARMALQTKEETVVLLNVLYIKELQKYILIYSELWLFLV